MLLEKFYADMHKRPLLRLDHIRIYARGTKHKPSSSSPSHGLEEDIGTAAALQHQLSESIHRC